MMRLFKRQNGLTVLEILASLGISSMLIAGMVGVIFQTMSVTENNQPQVMALDDIRTVAMFITDDIRKAEGTDLVDGADPVDNVDLYWTDWTETRPYRHECSLALSGTMVTRTRDAWIDVDLDWWEDGDEEDIDINEDLVVGSYITDIEFSRDDDVIIVSITSSPGGTTETEETRTYRIAMMGLEDPVR